VLSLVQLQLSVLLYLESTLKLFVNLTENPLYSWTRVIRNAIICYLVSELSTQQAITRCLKKAMN